MPADPFAHTNYLLRRKVLKLFGGAFHIFDPDGQLVLYSHMKAFKLREDIRVYDDEARSTELLTIHARQMLDISATYDVVDARNGQKVGALRRRGLKSVLKDEWAILDADDRVIGLIKEDSLFMALIRRFVTNLLPQTFHAEMEGIQVAEYKQNFNPFVQKVRIDLSLDVDHRLDRRLGLAAAVLLCAIEGRQG